MTSVNNTYSSNKLPRTSRLALRRSQLERRLSALGASFAPFGKDSSLAISFKKSARRGAVRANTGVLLCDLSPLSRIGLKGTAMPALLKSAEIALPTKVNEASQHKDRSLCLRIAVNEVLLLSALASDGETDFRTLHKALSEYDRRSCWTVPYQDSFCWLALAGARVGEMFAKLCAVDLDEGSFAPLMIAQTSLARLGAVIVRAPTSRGSRLPLFYLLCDNASSGYLWDCLVDAMEEWRGAVVSRGELLKLV